MCDEPPTLDMAHKTLDSPENIIPGEKRPTLPTKTIINLVLQKDLKNITFCEDKILQHFFLRILPEIAKIYVDIRIDFLCSRKNYHKAFKNSQR